MKTIRLFDGGILLVAVIIIAAIVAAGGLSGLRSSEGRCAAYAAAHAEWVKQGRPGGASAERRIELLYGVSQAVCDRR